MMKNDVIVAYLGRLDISNWTEEYSQPRGISEIYVYPEFDFNGVHTDLAILRFSKKADPSDRVMPACLWKGLDDLNTIVGTRGLVNKVRKINFFFAH